MLGRTLITILLLAWVVPATSVYAADAATGKKVSAKHCAKCHGDTGTGNGEGLKKIKADVTPVDWTSKAAMAKWSEADLVKIIREGGKASGKSKIMPAYQSKLSDAEVADVIAYIRSLAK